MKSIKELLLEYWGDYDYGEVISLSKRTYEMDAENFRRILTALRGRNVYGQEV